MKSDIVIIGGGAIGLCTAYYLKQSGASVTVIDRGEMGQACSLHNAGYLSPSHFVPLAAPGMFTQGLKWMANPASPLYIKPRIDLEFFRWAMRFRKACDESTVKRAAPLLRDLLQKSLELTAEMSKGMDFSYTKKGLTILFNSDRGRKACEHEAAMGAELGVVTRMMDKKQLNELDPEIDFTAHGGLHFPGDAHVVPADYMRQLTADLSRSGITLMSNTNVTGMTLAGGKVASLMTDRGVVEGKNFVLASGSWSPEVARQAGVKLSLQPGKGYSITIDNPPVKPRIPYIFTERRVAITPFPGSLRFAGTMEFSGFNLDLNQVRINAILDAVPSYFGNIARPDPAKQQLWCGLRPVTPDGMPYIGPTRSLTNLIIATGHAMLGISLSAVTGNIVADLLLGRKPAFDLTLLDPGRFD